MLEKEYTVRVKTDEGLIRVAFIDREKHNGLRFSYFYCDETDSIYLEEELEFIGDKIEENYVPGI